MRIILKDLRSTAAMAQFSPREVPSTVLRFIETNSELPGETLLSIDPDSVRVIDPKAI